MNLEAVEQIVAETITSLPDEFKNQLENVEVVVEAWPNHVDVQDMQLSRHSLLFGLYRGVPKTKRGSNYSALPDKITIFAGPILMVSHSLDDAKKRIKQTTIHEIGHFFGMSDEQMRNLERTN